jgi:hypothetical protein
LDSKENTEKKDLFSHTPLCARILFFIRRAKLLLPETRRLYNFASSSIVKTVKGNSMMISVDEG